MKKLALLALIGMIATGCNMEDGHKRSAEHEGREEMKEDAQKKEAALKTTNEELPTTQPDQPAEQAPKNTNQ